MAFTSVAEDVIVQEGTFAFDYDASGTVYAGQGVYAIGTLQVKAPAATTKIAHGCVGVAAYEIADGNPVAVYGPGNIVRCKVSGSSVAVAAGDAMACTAEGYFTEDHQAQANACCSGVQAIALETSTTQHGTIRALLV